MSSEKRKLGDRGERIAAEFLERKGYRIRERQWRCKLGEIDIVAEQNGTLVIVEVKSLRDARYGPPELAIRPEKSRKLTRLVQFYQSAKQLHDRSVRVDVVAIQFEPDGTATLRHHENALADLPYVDSRRGSW